MRTMTGDRTIMIIDDEPDMLDNCSRILRRLGYETITVDDSVRAIEMLSQEQPDLILTDLKMPRLDGLAVLRSAKEINPEVPVIVITGYATVESAVSAVKEGAFDYLPKPFSFDQLRLSVERALAQLSLREENQNLKEQLEGTYGFDNIIGASPALREVLETVRKVSKSEASILIFGESGTGKELIARSIHANSQRFNKPFVPVDCASLPENLLESELFGHEKGAFTGAHAAKAGLFELAHQGTLFLDEIGELSMGLQAKLLRVLEERQFRRVGGTKMLDVDVRLVSATNRDLAESVENRQFRQDLYYRLNVISIHLPPLRERAGDIPLLALYYCKKFAEGQHKNIKGISPEALKLLESYPWPGNIRELRNAMERAVSLADSQLILPVDLPPQLLGDPPGNAVHPAVNLPFKEAKEKWVEVFEKDYLCELLKKHQGNISQAAIEAEMDRKTIHRLVKKHGLKVFRDFD